MKNKAGNLFKTMTDRIQQEIFNTTVGQLHRNFSGRIGSQGYIPTALYHIHRRNRAFVWKAPMWNKLLDSILNGYPIPPLYCESKIEEDDQKHSIERRYIMEGGNRITTLRLILNNEVRPLTEEERREVESFPIQIVVMRGLTSKSRREIFRRLNKSVKVSDGQLYMMSLDDSVLVQEAYSLLKDNDHPLRDFITHHFFDTREDLKDESKSHLANAVALVSGVLHGVDYITKSFQEQEEHVESSKEIDSNQVNAVLSRIFSIFTEADGYVELQKKNDKKKQWNVGYLLGPMMYDYHTISDFEDVRTKWSRFIVSLRTNENGSAEVLRLAGAQNLNATRYKRLSVRVQIYLQDRRIASKEELATYVHSVDESDLEESDEEVE